MRKSQQRREEILRLAAETGLASVETLADRFDVTASTIRRDLAELSGSGRIARTYGGAMAVPLGTEASMTQRAAVAADAKLTIARWAAGRITAGSSLLLDGGTTVAQVARMLPRVDNLNVTTISLPVIGSLQSRDDVRVYTLGGRLRPLSSAFIGPLAEATLERMSFDLAFLGADGVTSDGDVCEAELDQTRLKELMGRRARRVYLLVHADKLNKRPYQWSSRLDEHWTIVTDDSADPDVVAEFTDAGIDVVVVPTDRDG